MNTINMKLERNIEMRDMIQKVLILFYENIFGICSMGEELIFQTRPGPKTRHKKTKN